MRKTAWLLALLACAASRAQTVPQATDLPSHPFFIKSTWYIGGAGNWDYLTMDPQAGRLYIAHGTTVQAVDVDSGALAGEITGFYEAREIALDDADQLGYISDGGMGKVTAFDRQTLKKVAEIDIGPNPRSLVYDPLTRLLFVVRANPPGEGPNGPSNRRRAATRAAPPAQRGAQQSEDHGVQSFVTIIDTQSQTAIGEIVLPGLLGFAVVDDSDEVYVSVTDRNEVFRFDAQAVAALLHRPPESAGPSAAESAEPAEAEKEPGKESAPWVTLDWADGVRSPGSAEGHLRVFNLSPDCSDPRSMAMDSAHLRLFAACDNRSLIVLNAADGNIVTTLPIGPGVDAVGYDPEHGMIFTANGGAEGSLTIIRQDVTDTYAVIQTLPTRQRASTLAVNPDTGAVYLVTDYLGVDLSHPGGIGALKTTPVAGSFQVLQVAD